MIAAFAVGDTFSHRAEAASLPVAVIQIFDQAPHFSPATIVVRVGQTVEWVNAGKSVHSVSNDRATVANPANVSAPKGAAPFDSGFVPSGGKFDYAFTTAGVYRYVCVPHEKPASAGTITVKR